MVVNIDFYKLDRRSFAREANAPHISGSVPVRSPPHFMAALISGIIVRHCVCPYFNSTPCSVEWTR